MDDREIGAAEIEARLATLESELARLSRELAEVRALARAVPRDPVPAPVPEAAAEPPPAAPSVPEPPPFWPPPPPPKAAPAPASAPRPSAGPTAAPPRPAPARPRQRSLGDLARDWDLVGPLGFAIAGGAVTALGIGFFFVLAANRGWIDETTRVALGAIASALAVGGGLLLRSRYGQYLSALAAVGAGIAGAYATLAAAAARYDLVPDALALPLAGVIAAVATAIALRWNSQLLAAIGLLGAALAPALQAIDTELGWVSAAFAVIVLLAAAAVSIPRGWLELLVATAALVGVQVEWLVADADVRANVGTVLVTGAFLLTLLAISVARQLVCGRGPLDQAALSFALVATGATLLLTSQLFQDQTNRGIGLLAAAAAWALVFAGLRAWGYSELALVVGTAGLALAAVGTADLLSDAALTLAWSAEAVLLAFLARRLRDVRLQVLALAYATLSAGHALVAEARIDLLFQEDTDQMRGALPLFAAAAGFVVAGVFAPESYVVRTESGPLAFVHRLRVALDENRHSLREALVFVGTVLATLGAAFALVSISFDAGHIAATALAAAVGATILAIAGQRGSEWLAFAAYYWLGAVVVEAVAFDVPDVSGGGWSALAAAAGLLGGAYANRLFYGESRVRDAVAGVTAILAALTAGVGIAEVTDTRVAGGLATLVLAAAYAGLSAGVFRRAGLRDFATTLWGLGLALVLVAEGILIDSPPGTALAAALTGAGVALLARPLVESRLWIAGGLAVSASTVVTVVFFTPPSHVFQASETPAARLWVLVGCIVALLVLGLTAESAVQRLRLEAVAGALSLFALSLGILEIAERVSSASIATDFERGHTAVSALWALVGLGLLVMGLLRGSAVIRYAGLALFGLTLAKIFLYDLAELSSIARAFSFILVGAFLLAGGFFLQRLSDRIGPRSP
jgi:uncharacterized membrane protein